MNLECRYFSESLCRSCEGLDVGLNVWRQQSLDNLKTLIQSQHWYPAVHTSKSFGSRNKAKLAVGGTIDNPLLGRFTSDGKVVDLKECQLHSPFIQQNILLMYDWIKDYKLEPYNVETRKGELKSIIVVEGDHESLMIRFVVRSKESLDRIKKLSVQVKAQNPFHVISVNIQPLPSAILEGEEEIVVSEKSLLNISYNENNLKLPIKSFIQTNHFIATKLYQTAATWAQDIDGRCLELFCGIGGFSSHLIKEDREVVGVELSESAINAARMSTPQAEFLAMDAWEYLKSVPEFELIVVNPPRRGLGKEICLKLNLIQPKHILYSSCSPESLKNDLENLDYKIEKIQAFEMFPLTNHWEVLCLLTLNLE